MPVGTNPLDHNELRMSLVSVYGTDAFRLFFRKTPPFTVVFWEMVSGEAPNFNFVDIRLKVL
mgnify:CR=1 FL=1|jgi:hypothetical protein